MRALPRAALRDDFPTLKREVNGHPLVYLDSAASAQKPRFVLDAMEALYTHSYANVHRGLHTLSGEATQAYETAREKVQAFLNADSAQEIVFTSGGTDAINLVASGFLGPQIKEGDEIVLSVLEHHSNIVPWHFLRERKGARIKWADCDDTGVLSVDNVAAQISPKTRFLSVTHVSNVLGTVTPLKEIIRMAHERNVPVLVDGCQGAVHQEVDVQSLGCDFYAFTGHKLYGPTGVGVLYGKREHLEAMRPVRGGGEMIREVSREAITYDSPPHRFEAGTPPILEAVGLGAAVDYLTGLDLHAVRTHEAALRAALIEQLAALDDIKVFAAPEGCAIVSFGTSRAHPHDIAAILDRKGVAVRAGHHCAQVLMERLGVPAVARASLALYNTLEDVEKFILATRESLDFFT